MSIFAREMNSSNNNNNSNWKDREIGVLEGRWPAGVIKIMASTPVLRDL